MLSLCIQDLHIPFLSAQAAGSLYNSVCHSLGYSAAVSNTCHTRHAFQHWMEMSHMNAVTQRNWGVPKVHPRHETGSVIISLYGSGVTLWRGSKVCFSLAWCTQKPEIFSRIKPGRGVAAALTFYTSKFNFSDGEAGDNRDALGAQISRCGWLFCFMEAVTGSGQAHLEELRNPSRISAVHRQPFDALESEREEKAKMWGTLTHEVRIWAGALILLKTGNV